MGPFMRGPDEADFFVGRVAFLKISFVIGIMMCTEESLTGGEIGGRWCVHCFVYDIRIDIKNESKTTIFSFFPSLCFFPTQMENNDVLLILKCT